MQLPAIARPDKISTDHAGIRPIEKLERKILVTDGGLADRLVQFRTGNAFRTAARDFVETGTVDAEADLERFFRISEEIANDRTILNQPERNDGGILPQLAAQIDLLPRLS